MKTVNKHFLFKDIKNNRSFHRVKTENNSLTKELSALWSFGVSSYLLVKELCFYTLYKFRLLVYFNIPQPSIITCEPCENGRD